MIRRRRATLPALGALLALASTGCGSTPPPATPDRSVDTYVALGDGFTAAPYAGDTTDDKCLRSDANYPTLVADRLGADLTDVSCTGATSEALTERSKRYRGKGRADPQLAAVTADTDLITIGIGIEDGDTLDQLLNVCVELPCGDRVVAQVLVNAIGAAGVTLTESIRDLQARAPKADIVIVGYPDPFPRADRCKALPRVSDDELEGASAVLDVLDRALRSSARETGSSYVDVARLATGHDACADDPWFAGRKNEKGRQVAYHPTAAEQRAVADAILALVDGS